MPPRRKRAAKKTAAPKPARRASWAFGEGRYLSTVSINRNSVSSGASVEILRGALGLPAGIYDREVWQAVMDAQEAAGLPVTGIVAEADWDVIVNGSAAPASGGVDGADEGDPPAVLDPPEGS